MNEQIQEILYKNRPNLSIGSIRTYKSILRNLFNKISTNKEFDIKEFTNKDTVYKIISEMKPTQRKTVLSALVVILDKDEEHEECKEEYKKKMLEDIKHAKEETVQQKKNEDIEYIDWEDVLNIYKGLKKDVGYLLKSKSNELTPKEFNILQDYIILSLYVLISPRRSLDYVELKFKNYDENKDNYIDFKNKKLIFHIFKTAKFYNRQEVDIPKELLSILKKWLQINNNDFVLIDTKGNKLSAVTLNQRLNKIFDMKISVNALRHSYLSNKYKDMPNLKNMLDTAETMGHSLETAFEYVKK